MANNISLPDGRGVTQGWLMTEKKAHQAMWKFGTKNATAIVVLHFLTSRLNRGTNGVVISYEAISQEMGIAKRTAQSAIAALAEANFIQILKSGKSNIYVVNHQVAWQGNRGARFAAFGAEILVSENEQSKPVDQLIEEAKTLQPVPIADFNERVYVQNNEIEPPDQQELDLP